MSVKKEILSRTGLVYIVFLLMGLAIIARIIYLQFVIGDKLREIARKNFIKEFPVEASRGDILACDGRLLATSIPYYNIRIDSKANGFVSDSLKKYINPLSESFSKLFKDKTPKQYKALLNKAYQDPSRNFLIKRKINYTEMRQLKNFPFFKFGPNKSGLIIETENRRYTLNSSLALRTIGYVNKNSQRVGIEGSFNDMLQGTNGKRLMQRLAGGAWMPVNDENEIEPRDGYDIVTTIDINIQDVAESALRKQLSKSEAEAGCAVLMEVATGEIRAIVNLGKDKNGGYSEIKNYAILENTEPGSTFKLASVMAAMEDGYVTPATKVDTRNGSISYHGEELTDHGKGYGMIPLQHAFEISSNVGISWMITKFYDDNPRQFVERLYAMSLNKKLNLDLKGDVKPVIKYPSKQNGWTKISLPWMSVGYEVLITPIYTLTFYNAVANNGKMIKPKFVKKILYHGKTIKEFEPEVISESICSSKTLEYAHQLLEGVVDTGTAKNLKNNTYKIAGKTGTARVSVDSKGYTDKHQASFVGYFPADNPKYTCIVVVYQPSAGSYYGNAVAGPVFKEIADKVYVTNLKMQPALKADKEMKDVPVSKSGLKSNLDYIFKNLNILTSDSDDLKSDWVNTQSENNQIKYSNRPIIKKLVPNVVDMGLSDALYLLENAGLKVIVHGKGKVIQQSLNPGTLIKQGDIIVLELKVG